MSLKKYVFCAYLVVLHLRFFRCWRLCSYASTSWIVAAAMQPPLNMGQSLHPLRRLFGQVGCYRLPTVSEVSHFDPCPFGCLWSVKVQDCGWQVAATFEGHTFLIFSGRPKSSKTKQPRICHYDSLSASDLFGKKYENHMWNSILLGGKCNEVNTRWDQEPVLILCLRWQHPTIMPDD